MMPTTSHPLADRVAVVTGAGRGIGRAIAIGFAEAGASVICAARTGSEINDTVAAIERAGGSAYAIPTDVTDEHAVQQLFQKGASHFGTIDLLVINAGVSEDRNSVEDSSPASWRTTLEVNLYGAYLCARSAIPYLKNSNGAKIITVGSGMGHKGRPNSSAYSCSKAGLWMLTRILAQELWQYGISVNELIPGPVNTMMTSSLRMPSTATDQPEGSEDSPLATQPDSVFQIQSEWIKEPQDVVPIALFLATQPPTGPTAQSFSLMRRDN